MYHRNRCIDETTEILRRTLREAVHPDPSEARRREAPERAQRLRRMALAVGAGLSALALSLPFWG